MIELPLDTLLLEPPADVWQHLFEMAFAVCSPPLPPGKESNAVMQRDRDVSSLDLFLSSVAWDLWQDYLQVVPRTADVLATWWRTQATERAVLILDALSLRELPWLLHGAQARGFRVHQCRVTAAELPADTNAFARALGFPSRSALSNNGASHTHRLPGAQTESVNYAWQECSALIKPTSDHVFWHWWPDEQLHHFGAHGGLQQLTQDVAAKLQSDAFWEFIDRLCTGRRLVITADHGYAYVGHFLDAEPSQIEHLRGLYKSQRYAEANGSPPGAWSPPIDTVIETSKGSYLFPLGRRKWPSHGGYPTLTHGGLSILEVAVPFLEISQ